MSPGAAPAGWSFRASPRLQYGSAPGRHAVVRLRKLAEPPGPDRRPALRQRPGGAVHAVHDTVTGPEDHRVRQVRLSHAPEVPGDLPDRGRSSSSNLYSESISGRSPSATSSAGRPAGRQPGGQRPKRPSGHRPARSGTASASLQSARNAGSSGTPAAPPPRRLFRR
jgi:hypothetical protein